MFCPAKGKVKVPTIKKINSTLMIEMIVVLFSKIDN